MTETPLSEETQDARIDDLVTYHAPDPEQLEAIQNMRECTRIFLRGLLKNVPPSADRTHAEMCARTALSFANAAICRRGRP